MNHVPRKRFGQNFLRDSTVIARIVQAVAPTATDHLVEIGPGEGVLTRELLPLCHRLDAVELDRDLVKQLTHRFQGEPRFHLHAADALSFDFRALSEGTPLRLVGNLPYNISTPLLFGLFGQLEPVEDLHFMLQKEVVERLCARPGSKDYGRLTVMTACYCETEHLFDVEPESFHPPPRVTSSIIRLRPHTTPPVNVSHAALSRIVMAAFSQRRKTLRNALKDHLDAAGFEQAGIDPGRRAETLSLSDYASLTVIAEQGRQPQGG